MEEYNNDADQSDASIGSESKYHTAKFSDVSEFLDESIVKPDAFTTVFSIAILLFLFSIYFVFFGALFIDTIREEL